MNKLDVDDLENGKLDCPVCNKNILDYGGAEMEDLCSHVMLVYTDIVPDEFCHIHKSMKKIAEQMLKKVNDEDSEISLCDLMEECAEKSKGKYEVIGITSSGLCCGPCSNTDYVMVKVK